MQTIKELKSMTVQQLRKLVWSEVKEANIRLTDISDKQSQRMAAGIKSTYGSTGKGKFVGRVNYKTKSELIGQIRSMQRFNEFDTTSSYAKRKEKEVQKEKYFRFLETSGIKGVEDLTLDEFNRLMDIYSTNQDILDNFGYREVGDALVSISKHNELHPEDKKTPEDLVAAMKQTMREKGDLDNQDILLDALYDNLNINRREI